MCMTVLRLGAVALALNGVVATAAIALDQNLPAYRPAATLSGHIKSVGSDTLGHEAALWASGFEKLYPDVKIEIDAKDPRRRRRHCSTARRNSAQCLVR